jgi:hypothetical protein
MAVPETGTPGGMSDHPAQRRHLWLALTRSAPRHPRPHGWPRGGALGRTLAPATGLRVRRVPGGNLGSWKAENLARIETRPRYPYCSTTRAVSGRSLGMDLVRQSAGSGSKPASPAKGGTGQFAVPPLSTQRRIGSRKADIRAGDRVQEVMAEPFPGTLAQGTVLVFAREMNASSFAQKAEG